MQSSESDEFVYHECLIHPIMLAHKSGAKRVFVGGGGEGATIREIFRHNSVEECWMVDIDGDCVESCRKFLPNHHKGAFEDSRLKLIIDDAKKVLEQDVPEQYFDIIVCDLADPTEGGPCVELYTQNFYKMCLSKLRPGGLLVTQSGPAGLTSFTEVFSPVHSTLRSVVGQERTFAYTVNVPSFLEDYGYNLVITDDESNPLQLTSQEIDARIEQRLKNGSKDLRFYDGITHHRLFALPKYIRKGLEEEKRVITTETPVYMP